MPRMALYDESGSLWLCINFQNYFVLSHLERNRPTLLDVSCNRNLFCALFFNSKVILLTFRILPYIFTNGNCRC